MPAPLIQPFLPPADLGSDAAEYLSSLGLTPRFPCIRSSDAAYIDKPFVYYLARILGITPIFNSSDASAQGVWGHYRASLPGDYPTAQVEKAMLEEFRRWTADITVSAAKVGFGESGLASVILSEKTRMMEAWTWYDTASQFVTRFGGITDNPREWKVLGSEVLALYADPAYSPRRPGVAQYDKLLLHIPTDTLWIRDYKFTGGSRTFRATTVPYEFQTQHYLAILKGALPQLIERFGLSSKTRAGGMEHVIVATPSIGISQKDREYKWVSEGKRSGVSGEAFKTEEGWRVSCSAPIDGLSKFKTEEEALRELHALTGKTPEKEYRGEPSWQMYSKRVDEWYKGKGNYGANSVEFSTDPPVLISRTGVELMSDPDILSDYGKVYLQLHRWATLPDPCPRDFARTSQGMISYRSPSPSIYAPFFHRPVAEWPELMKQNLLIVKPRDRELWNNAPNGVVE